jgi:ribonuclease HI
VPVIECDPSIARERLVDAGVDVQPGNTAHELWRAEHGGAIAVAYEGKVTVQGQSPEELLALLREEGGRAHVYFDGASRGNPGPAAVGWVIVTGDGIVSEGGKRIDETTNNRAEYEALIQALSVAADYGFDSVELRGDSELVVNQVKGAWNVNEPSLRERRVQARTLLEQFDEWTLTHVPREINERADTLANEALDN